MMLILHLREINFHEDFFEWGSSVAHTRRDRGATWKRAVDIWATHLYFAGVNWNDLPVEKIPVHLFDMFLWAIDFLSKWQLANDFDDLFIGGLTREEAVQTLFHLYGLPKQKREIDERSGFVFLVDKKTSDPRDLEFVRRLIRLCEPDALNMTPKSMLDYINVFEQALRRLGGVPWRLSSTEAEYLQLHFLVCLHNTIIDLDYDLFALLTGTSGSQYTAMLSASAMHTNLSLDIAFYYRNKRGDLDQADLESGNERFPNLTYPVVKTDLPERVYLLENDENIIACLYNYPLEVVLHNGKPRLIALDRTNCSFPITQDPRNPDRADLPDVSPFRKNSQA